jgi:site-specific DNA-methyltransferase (adenine-specific)
VGAEVKQMSIERVDIGDDATLYLGDCLDVLPTLEDGSVDAVVTDPPYSSGGQFRSEKVRPANEKYRGWSHGVDETRKPSAFYSAFSGDNKDTRVFMAWSKVWMDAAFTVARDGAYFGITTDWRQLPAVTDTMQYAGWTWRGLLVWNKKIGRPVAGRYRNHIEYIAWGSRGAFNGNQRVYADSLHVEAPPTHVHRVHVTEKPVGLIEYALSVVAAPSIILDPFMGSGTTGVACVKLGRKFIGIEIDRGYFDIAVKRIRQAIEEQGLFRQEKIPVEVVMA